MPSYELYSVVIKLLLSNGETQARYKKKSGFAFSHSHLKAFFYQSDLCPTLHEC